MNKILAFLIGGFVTCIVIVFLAIIVSFKVMGHLNCIKECEKELLNKQGYECIKECKERELREEK